MDEEEQLQFKLLRKMRVHHHATSCFVVETYGNDMIITYPGMEAIVLKILNEADTMGQVPYSIENVDLPMERALSELIKHIDLRVLYGKLTVLERQEMGLDLIVTSNASVAPQKPNVMQAIKCKTHIITTTTYGECLIMAKSSHIAKQWDKVVFNITKFIINEVFPLEHTPSKANNVKTYAKLRSMLDAYIVTAVACHECLDIIYVATADGCLLVFNWNANTADLKLYTQLRLESGRVLYLKAFDDYLIVSSCNGHISLYQLIVNDNEQTAILVEHGLLWTDDDNLGCLQLIVERNTTPDHGYTIVCAKASFFIAFLLSRDGKFLGSGNLHMPDIKITGLEHFDAGEYIVTTISARVFRVFFKYATNDAIAAMELTLTYEEVTLASYNSSNNNNVLEINSIYGVGTTINKAIWFFLCNDNRKIGSREKMHYAYLTLWKPSTLKPLSILDNLISDEKTALTSLDPYIDMVWSFRMEAWALESAPYATYFPLDESLELPQLLDNKLMRTFQLALEIINAKGRRSSFTRKTVNQTFIEEIEFFQMAIQIVHILLRLQYLQQLKMLNTFQQKAVYFMHKAFQYFVEKLNTKSMVFDFVLDQWTERNQVLNEIKQKFVSMARQQIAASIAMLETTYEDVCFNCNEKLSENQFSCPECKNYFRCSVSFVPLNHFCHLKCTQCGILAYHEENDPNILAELFAPNETVKCTLCSANLVL